MKEKKTLIYAGFKWQAYYFVLIHLDISDDPEINIEQK